jgi:aminopeptidase
LAKNLVNFSCNVKKGENVLIEVTGIPNMLVKELVKAVHAAGAYPFVQINDQEINRELLLGTSGEHCKRWSKYDAYRMRDVDAYIAVRGGGNSYETSDVPADKMKFYSIEYSQKVHSEIRLSKKWVVLRYPTPSMAQSAGMSTEAFEDFYFNVCNLDYSKMNKAMDSLVSMLEKTDKVRILGKDTDLKFSVKGIPSIKCAGEKNIPDGELYTAPVRNSVNGKITYNTPSLNRGMKFENVCFEFKDGKIVNASCNGLDKELNAILDSDDGARYVGEFAIGVNPYINDAILDTLFDEKIAGSIHFTPGNAYDDADNGNRSSVHWDLVLIQTPQYGGGEIYFDGKLVRKDGRFIVKELECLNPENLK